jgi:tetratricopeptide (TPR) repeat protein
MMMMMMMTCVFVFVFVYVIELENDEQSTMKLLIETQKLIHDLELEKKDESISIPMDKEDEFLEDDEDDELYETLENEKKHNVHSPNTTTTATTTTTTLKRPTPLTDFEIRRSIKFNKRRLMTAKKVGEKNLQLQSYFNLGVAFHSLGDKERAKKCFLKALEMTKQLDDKIYFIKINCVLGDLYRDQKEMSCSFQHYETALELSKEIGDKELQSQVLESLE